MTHHTLYYRPEPGAEVQTIRIKAERDPGEIYNTVRDRLFTLTDEEKARQALHADRVLAGRK